MASPKSRSIFVCQECGYQSARWLGKCPDCSKWNSLVEETQQPETRHGRASDIPHEGPRPLSEIQVEAEPRITTGIGEFDRVLGGGIVPGSVILVGGDPGIGKSTLLLQASNYLKADGGEILYVSGEESVRQTKIRAVRLGTSSSDIRIVNETNLDFILDYITRLLPRVVVIDSIQVLYSQELSSSPGSVSQVRECAGRLTALAKSSNISIFLVGHVTKEGSIAGPRVLEHMVDTVLYFEGERHASFRILRAVKNRFGSTNEIGVFEMRESGLMEVKNPSEFLLSERPTDVPGSIVVPCIEGTRPVLVEVQALVTPTSFGLPRRRTTGLDYNRVSLLLAVLEKRVGLGLGNQDVFVNVAGGLNVAEPALDLGVAIAVASSLKEVPTKKDDIVFGEIGLAGEVRAVSYAQQRLIEAEKMGFKRCLVSKYNLKGVKPPGKMEVTGVLSIREGIDLILA